MPLSPSRYIYIVPLLCLHQLYSIPVDHLFSGSGLPYVTAPLARGLQPGPASLGSAAATGGHKWNLPDSHAVPPDLLEVQPIPEIEIK